MMRRQTQETLIVMAPRHRLPRDTRASARVLDARPTPQDIRLYAALNTLTALLIIGGLLATGLLLTSP